MFIRSFLVASSLAVTSIAPAFAKPVPTPAASYLKVLNDTTAMVYDATARSLASRHGLDIVNVTWEDTGRYKGSSVGPNISDMTIQVQHKNSTTGAVQAFLMPVIRHPNFSDKTADIALEDFHLLVGNEKGKDLKRVSLRDFLGNIRRYLSDGKSWKGDKKSLLAARDTHALVSAQAAFLPIPKSGEATFNPVLFNYQSVKDDPAVLTILVTRQGTSVTVIDNVRDGFDAGGAWGQRLFFNKDGQRASLTGKRLTDFKLDEPDATKPGTPTHAASAEEGLNMVLLIQVPLKQKNPMRFGGGFAEGDMMMEAAPQAAGARGASDVENAVIGHGALEGPFTEIDGLEIERDERFPVRVTVQFYKATSNGVVNEADLKSIKQQIDKVYDDGEYVGSLVTEGETGRPTEYDGDKTEPADWWRVFWKRHFDNTGLTPQATWDRIQSTVKPGFVAGPWMDRMMNPFKWAEPLED
ncbi:MAG TPA: hypothetical protein PK095_05640 [Myxococcota bacterium]|nr:hypothetical protein [Myxococcota bacterium]